MSRNSKKKRNAQKAIKIRKNNQAKALKAHEKMDVPTIFLDESGNTGSNLLDDTQPVFTLASCKFSKREAETLLKLIGSNSSHEVHFKNLKRRKSGQNGIVRLMSHRLINLKNIKVNIFLKEFMITTKIVDTLVEHQMHLEGKDLYLNGQNIALSNVLYYGFLTFCNSELVQNMYRYFVMMIRNQDKENVDLFYESTEKVKESSTFDNFKDEIDLILSTQSCVVDALQNIDKTILDPSIPALFSHCVRWGQQHPKGFHVIHDDSHSIEKQRYMFARFMDWTQDNIQLGYDRRKFDLPLKGKSFKFDKSEAHAQLQVADIIASSFAYWASCISRKVTDDCFFQELDKLNFDKFIGHNKIWPSPDVTPQELNTVHDGGINPVNHIPAFLINAKPNPKVINT